MGWNTDSKNMTNLEAIRLVSSELDLECKASAVAGIFLKEDIIEHDVKSWVKIPTHNLLSQFVALSEDSASNYINEIIETEGDLLSEEHLMDLSERYQDVIQTLIEYVRIRLLIIEQSER